MFICFNEQGLSKSEKDLPIAPGVLMAPAAEEGGGAALGIEDMPDDMQVRSGLEWSGRGQVDVLTCIDRRAVARSHQHTVMVTGTNVSIGLV